MSGFPNPRVLGLVQHVHAIARGELMGVSPRLKNVSFCQQRVDKVGHGSRTRWFRVISSSKESSDCGDQDREKYHGVVLG